MEPLQRGYRYIYFYSDDSFATHTYPKLEDYIRWTMVESSPTLEDSLFAVLESENITTYEDRLAPTPLNSPLISFGKVNFSY